MDVYKFKIVLIIIFSIISNSLFCQNCNCNEVIIDFGKQLEKNYVAFEVKTKDKLKYNKFYNQILAKAKGKDKINCLLLMNEYIDYFNDLHLSVGINVNEFTPKDFKSFPTYKKDSVEWKKVKNKDWIEGFWRANDTTPGYKIWIVKVKENSFLGVVIHSDFSNWKKWQIKMRIAKEGESYKVVYYTKNYGVVKQIIRPYNANEFNLSGVPWIRFENYVKEKAIRNNDSDIAFQKLSSKTNLLTIKSFDYGNKEILDSIIDANRNMLDTTQNLIVDIRDNGGGNAGVYYSSLIKYLYSNPIKRYNTIYKASIDNIKIYAPNGSDTTEQEKLLIKKMQNNIGKLIGIDTIDSYYSMDSIKKFPLKVGLLYNRKSMSASELMILNLQNNKRIISFGENSGGAIDNANMTSGSSLFCKYYKYGYATVTTLNSIKNPIDKTGILPNVLLHGFEETWIKQVQNYLETLK